MSYADEYGGYAAAAAFTSGVPPDLFLAQIQQESGFDPNAFNPTGSTATGIGQFIPSTASAIGLDPNDPYASLDAAAQLDTQNYEQSGSWLGSLTAYGTLPSSGDYNAGQQNVANIAGSYDTAANDFGYGSYVTDPVSGYSVISGQGGAVTTTGLGSGVTQTGVIPGAPGTSQVGTGIGSSLSTIASFFSGLTSGAIWQRFGLFFIGAIFLVGALFLTKTGQNIVQKVVP